MSVKCQKISKENSFAKCLNIHQCFRIFAMTWKFKNEYKTNSWTGINKNRQDWTRMHLHWERSHNTAGDCNIRSLSWMGRVPDEIPQVGRPINKQTKALKREYSLVLFSFCCCWWWSNLYSRRGSKYLPLARSRSLSLLLWQNKCSLEATVLF